jgi:diguanylate cyclase
MTPRAGSRQPEMSAEPGQLTKEVPKPEFKERRTGAREYDKTSDRFPTSEIICAIFSALLLVLSLFGIVDWSALLLAGFTCLACQVGFIVTRWHRNNAAFKHIKNAGERRGFSDPLTGLSNRAGYKRDAEQALADRTETQPVGIIYIDLDRFKEVNDNYGHDMGDKLLLAVAGRIGNATHDRAKGARLGGDEFALVVHGCTSAQDIVEIGETVSKRLGQPFSIDGVELVIGGSVGIAIAPEDGDDFAELVRRADISMYKAKAAGRGVAIRFDPAMEDYVRNRKVMEDELRHAVERNELQMVYQPVMAADGETVRGVEALVRWNNPKLGAVSPGEFIPLAEETGLINSIGDWTVRMALADARDWDDLHIAVNVSPVQFRGRNLAERLVAIANDTGINPRRVEIEVTEGVLIRDADKASTTFKILKDAGMRIALDDFGTGFSSLSYLRRFQFDKLKIDQVFVRSLSSERGSGSGSAAIIHNVVSLGRSLGLTVQAEGVETLEHHIFLRAAGCHCLQGFYFAKPMPKAEIDDFIRKRRGFSYDDRRYG